MPYDPLVSESESSSGAASPTQVAHTLSGASLSGSSLQPDRDSPIKRDSSYDSPPKRRTDFQMDQTSPLREGTPSIQNEDLPTKVTLSASVMLSRLPPDSSRMISRATEPKSEKITIRCQPIGSAPELSPNVFKISYHQPFATLVKFLTKKLKKRLPNKDDGLYCYVNNSFAPSPDEIIGHLKEHFAVNGELVVSYCTVIAFG